MVEEARLEGGERVNWHHPPGATAMAQWSKRDESGRTVRGSFRTICHINRLNNLAQEKFGTGLSIIQPPFNTTVPASRGTHDFDACIDVHIPNVGFFEQQRFFRANGLGCWYRHPPLFGNHIHGFTLPPREGQVISDDFRVHGFEVGEFVDGGVSTKGSTTASSQIVDYYNHAFGLAGQHTANSDHSWFPGNITATIFDLQRYVANRAR